MIYLLDTNIVSEVFKREPNKNVISWLSSINEIHFCLSVITIGEIRRGAEKLDDSKRKADIIRWLEVDIIDRFAGRIINIDSNVADKWGYISANNNIPAIDGLIAASALVHNLKLVTRNTKDFSSVSGLELINPWE